jgi:hypothetical protein
MFARNVVKSDVSRELKGNRCYLVGDGSTIELDLDDVSLLLAAPQQLLLGVADDADGLAVLLHVGQVLLDLLLAEFVLPLQARLGERLLLGLRPVSNIYIPDIRH